jgi:hypothetical protein
MVCCIKGRCRWEGGIIMNLGEIGGVWSGLVVGSCKCSDKTSGSGTTDLLRSAYSYHVPSVPLSPMSTLTWTFTIKSCRQFPVSWSVQYKLPYDHSVTTTYDSHHLWGLYTFLRVWFCTFFVKLPINNTMCPTWLGTHLLACDGCSTLWLTHFFVLQ